MIKLTSMSLLRTAERAISSAFSGGVVEEGKALVFGEFDANGERTVKPSTGATGEEFAGFALATVAPVSTLNFYGEITLDAEGKGVLTHIPLAKPIIQGALAANITQNGTAVTVTDGTNPITGTFKVRYAYVVSATEAAQFQGDALPSQVTAVLGRVGVLEAGEVFTSNFDVSIDWDTLVSSKLGLLANGQIGSTDAGAKPLTRPATITSIPSSGDPFLGLTF